MAAHGYRVSGGGAVKRCDECRNEDGDLIHPSSVACNWLDDQQACPHCGGTLRWFRGTALGDLMDEIATLAAPERPTIDEPDDDGTESMS